MPLLAQDRIVEIANVFMELDLGSTVRPALLSGIPVHFKGLLIEGLPPKPQVMADLGKMNQIERLADGTVPLKIWLANAASLAMGTEQEKALQRALDDVAHIASGSPRLDPAKLPETKEVIVHQDDLLPYVYLEMGVAAARSVAKLRVPRFDGGQPKMINGTPERHLGTGWLLTPQLLITNHHVINARKEGEAPAPDSDLLLQGAATEVQFGFDGDGMEGQVTQAGQLEAWDAALDYAILRIPDPGLPALRRAAQRLEKAEGAYIPVNIIQHPEGTSKKLGIRNNLVTASEGHDLRYFTDTRRGSSGSPVMDDRWQVVALHRGATIAENVNFQGRSVAFVNVGTHLPSILKDLQDRFPALAAEVG